MTGSKIFLATIYLLWFDKESSSDEDKVKCPWQVKNQRKLCWDFTSQKKWPSKANAWRIYISMEKREQFPSVSHDKTEYLGKTQSLKMEKIIEIME